MTLADDALHAARHHFAQAERSEHPKAVKHHELAADYYDRAHLLFKAKQDERAELNMDKAERHADEAEDYDKLNTLSKAIHRAYYETERGKHRPEVGGHKDYNHSGS